MKSLTLAYLFAAATVLGSSLSFAGAVDLMAFRDCSLTGSFAELGGVVVSSTTITACPTDRGTTSALTIYGGDEDTSVKLIFSKSDINGPLELTSNTTAKIILKIENLILRGGISFDGPVASGSSVTIEGCTGEVYSNYAFTMPSSTSFFTATLRRNELTFYASTSYGLVVFPDAESSVVYNSNVTVEDNFFTIEGVYAERAALFTVPAIDNSVTTAAYYTFVKNSIAFTGSFAKETFGIFANIGADKAVSNIIVEQNTFTGVSHPLYLDVKSESSTSFKSNTFTITGKPMLVYLRPRPTRFPGVLRLEIEDNTFKSTADWVQFQIGMFNEMHSATLISISRNEIDSGDLKGRVPFDFIIPENLEGDSPTVRFESNTVLYRTSSTVSTIFLSTADRKMFKFTLHDPTNEIPNHLYKGFKAADLSYVAAPFSVSFSYNTYLGEMIEESTKFYDYTVKLPFVVLPFNLVAPAYSPPPTSPRATFTTPTQTTTAVTTAPLTSTSPPTTTPTPTAITEYFSPFVSGAESVVRSTATVTLLLVACLMMSV